MATDKMGIKDEISIKKETIGEKGEVKKTTFFFPNEDKSIEASSYEEALEILNKDRSK